MTDKSVLVTDDEPGHRLMVRAVLEDAGWRVFEAASGEEALALFRSDPQYTHVALVDMNMPGMDGQATLTRLHEVNAALPVILLTAYGTVGAAVEAMKRGAFDYLTKPADNDELVLTLNRAFDYSRLQDENTRLRSALAGDAALKPLVGASGPMRRIHEFIRQAGPSEATVLISGESGTGKELIVEALHACSGRAKKPLIKVNCAALPAQLLESELFGYERGAFTGAVKDKPGRFQLASGGTLFLDEIGEVPLELQAKLLRAIQDRVVEPLGSVRSVPVDVRILAASNRNLARCVAEGSFREDLYFRLNVLEVVSPPLRERLDDLPLLTSHLIGLLSTKNRKDIRGVSPAFMDCLSRYAWPGNVRELENVLERALILSRSDLLEPDSLPPQVVSAALQQTPPPSPWNAPQAAQPDRAPEQTTARADSSGGLLEEAERKALIQALNEQGGHREKTAEALGISRRTLQYKLKRFGLTRR
ncbi:sigma-54 dependent transcriptional regulator [Desulfovibrio sp. OttesenSCG-928-M14]|nr:sigma-54 dependent transcriptional regulator [Desulfovibrio sp. OttesenSCG-928-M14]